MWLPGGDLERLSSAGSFSQGEQAAVPQKQSFTRPIEVSTARAWNFWGARCATLHQNPFGVKILPFAGDSLPAVAVNGVEELRERGMQSKSSVRKFVAWVGGAIVAPVVTVSSTRITSLPGMRSAIFGSN